MTLNQAEGYPAVSLRRVLAVKTSLSSYIRSYSMGLSHHAHHKVILTYMPSRVHRGIMIITGYYHEMIVLIAHRLFQWS